MGEREDLGNKKNVGGGERFSHCCRKENGEWALTITCSGFASCWDAEHIIVKKGRRHEGARVYVGGWVRTSSSLSTACSFGPRPRIGLGARGCRRSGRGWEWGVGCNLFLFLCFFSASNAFRKQAWGHSNTQAFGFNFCGEDWSRNCDEVWRSKPGVFVYPQGCVVLVDKTWVSNRGALWKSTHLWWMRWWSVAPTSWRFWCH